MWIPIVTLGHTINGFLPEQQPEVINLLIRGAQA